MIEDTLQKLVDENPNEQITPVLIATITAIQILRKRLEKAEERVAKLDALEAYGVDNWEGYEEAMNELEGEEEDEEEEEEEEEEETED